MGETIKTIPLILMLIIVVSCPVAMAQEMNNLLPVEGTIVVKGQKALISYDGTDYLILKENNAYIQFEGRHIKMYNVKINSIKNCIEFTGFRFIDAYV